MPIGIAATPAPADVPGLHSAHVSEDWLLGIDPPPVGPTDQERRLFQFVWHSVLRLHELDPVLGIP